MKDEVIVFLIRKENGVPVIAKSNYIAAIMLAPSQIDALGSIP